MFGMTAERIDFDRMSLRELILVKSKLDVN